MGLDIVELFLRVEEVFGLDIPDAEAQKMITVGLMYRYLCDHRCGEDVELCPSTLWFHRLRAALVETYRVPRTSVRLDTRLDDLVPRVDRAAELARLSAALGAEDRRRCAGLGEPEARQPIRCDTIQIRQFAWPELTIRDLVHDLVLRFPPERWQAWSSTEVWEMLVCLIVEQLDVKPEQVTPLSRWVEDLGVC